MGRAHSDVCVVRWCKTTRLDGGGSRPCVYEASSNCILVTGITTSCGGIAYLLAIYSIVGLHC